MLTLVRLFAALVVADLGARLFGYTVRRVTPVVTPAPEVKRPSARRGVACPCDRCRVKRMIASCPVTAHQAPEGWQ